MKAIHFDFMLYFCNNFPSTLLEVWRLLSIKSKQEYSQMQ